MVAGELVVAVGHHEQQSQPVQPPHEIGEDVERRIVGPVHVFDGEHGGNRGQLRYGSIEHAVDRRRLERLLEQRREISGCLAQRAQRIGRDQVVQHAPRRTRIPSPTSPSAAVNRLLLPTPASPAMSATPDSPARRSATASSSADFGAARSRRLLGDIAAVPLPTTAMRKHQPNCRIQWRAQAAQRAARTRGSAQNGCRSGGPERRRSSGASTRSVAPHQDRSPMPQHPNAGDHPRQSRLGTGMGFVNHCGEIRRMEGEHRGVRHHASRRRAPSPVPSPHRARYFEPQLKLRFQRRGLFLAQASRFNQFVFVKLPNRGPPVDLRVKIGWVKTVRRLRCARSDGSSTCRSRHRSRTAAGNRAPARSRT